MTHTHRTPFSRSIGAVPVAALGLAMAIMLTGCSFLSGQEPDPAASTAAASTAPVAAQTTTVTRTDVVGVLTKTGTVLQGNTFQMHATTTGTITTVGERGVTITSDEGEDTTIELPAGAVLENLLVESGDRVTHGMAVANASYPGFAIALRLEPADLLRFVTPPLGIRAQVVGGSGPFDCTLLDPIPSISGEEPDATLLLCEVPESATVLAGMKATTVIQLERAEDALTLPVEAVAGTVDSGAVYLRGMDGEPVETPVTLGTTDGTRIVVTSGVEEGDTVYVPGPWIGDHDG